MFRPLVSTTAGLTAGLLLYFGSLPGCPLPWRLVLLGSCTLGALILLVSGVLALVRAGTPDRGTP